MVYTITFNPSLDYFVWMRNFELGKTNRTFKERMAPGGKGINVSVMLHSLGMESVAIGFTAGFIGKEIERQIKASGIVPEFIPCEGCSRVNVKLENFEGTEINGIGPEITAENLAALYRRFDSMQDGDCLVLGGSLPKSVPDTIYKDILQHLHADVSGKKALYGDDSAEETSQDGKLQGRKILTVVDTSGQQLLDVLPYHPFLIKPNVDELGEVFHREIYFRDDIEKSARLLQEKGAENVLVSMGSLGAIMIDAYGKLHELRAPKGHLISSVGSGDAMVAGFIYGYLNYHDYETAFRYGVAAGSASAFTSSFADKKAVEELYQKFWEHSDETVN